MRRRSLTLVTMCTGPFLVQLDVTIINVALPRLGDTAEVGGLQWIVDGYAIAFASLMLAGGTLGDRLGHRRVVLTGLMVFGAGSLACGLAGGIALLVVARTVQGGGAALLLPGTLAAITPTFPGERERARAIGIWPRCPGSRFPSARWPGTPPRRAGRSGIAAFGALAGSPAARSFLAGMHLAALIAALLYVAAAAASVALIPRAATSR